MDDPRSVSLSWMEVFEVLDYIDTDIPGAEAFVELLVQRIEATDLEHYVPCAHPS